MNKHATYARQALTALLLYTAFVIYGSLVPFEYRAHTLDQAIEKFLRIPWLTLDDTSRADWVANLVLYAPLTFLACATIVSGIRSSIARFFLVSSILVFSLLLATAIEFTQIFFSPRTVSLNDLLAETLGSLIGIAAWLIGRHRLSQLWHDFLSGGRRSLSAAIAAYTLVYLGLAFFPFDFVISSKEIMAKAGTNSLGWIIGNWQGSPLRILIRLVAESIAIAPLGILIGLLARQINLRRTFLSGFVFGAILESLQFLLISGISQGASAIMRGLGLVAGVLIGQMARKAGPLPLAHQVRRLVFYALPLYLIVLATATGWLRMPLLDLSQAIAKLPEVQLMPFYYHYYTTEPVAMASLLANLALYAPLGILAWARHTAVPSTRRRGPGEPALWAFLLALPVEASKLWLEGAHPDPSNLLIGAAGAVLTYLLVNWLALASQYGSSQARPAPNENLTQKTPLSRPGFPRSIKHSVIPLGAACLLLFGIWHYPPGIIFAGLLVSAYAAMLRRHPLSWLLILPAMLPVLNFAPFTGRLLLDEFDLLILTTLAIGYWRAPSGELSRALNNRTYRAGAWLLLASAVVSTALGLWPIINGSPLSFSSSHSPLEALMIGKGIFWALLLLPLFLRIPKEELAETRRWLIYGLATGLVLLSLFVLLERHIFVGIGDTDNVFRVTGTFFDMYNGGAYIEAFIAISFPSLVIWILQQKSLLLRLVGIGMAALASYAMLVTFSRGGYAGLAAGLAMATYLIWRSKTQFRLARILLIGVTLAVTAAAAPVFVGSFAQDRLNRAWEDLHTRLDHWQGAIELMDSGMASALTGMGFGRYSDAYLWKSKGTLVPGTFSLLQKNNRHYLRLGSGDAFYLDQVVILDPDQQYSIHARLRFSGRTTSLNVPLCEKALLYSFHCNKHSLEQPTGALPGVWHEISLPLNTQGMGKSTRWPNRTIKLSLANPQNGGTIDVSAISLVDSAGNNLLKNSNFNQGLAYWLPSTDRDIAWHIHQTALEVYFAQGLLGLLASFTLLLAAGQALYPPLRRGDPAAIALTSGLVGFVCVSLLGSTLDTARLNFLFYLLAFSGSLFSNKALSSG